MECQAPHSGTVLKQRLTEAQAYMKINQHASKQSRKQALKRG